jgi:hypothetical protein
MKVYMVQDERTGLFYHRVGKDKTWVPQEKASPLTKQGAFSVIGALKHLRFKTDVSPVVREYELVEVAPNPLPSPPECTDAALASSCFGCPHEKYCRGVK